jgi:hypothetical protein
MRGRSSSQREFGLVISFNFHAFAPSVQTRKTGASKKPRAQISSNVTPSLVHLSNKSIDLVLTISKVTTFHKMPEQEGGQHCYSQEEGS